MSKHVKYIGGVWGNSISYFNDSRTRITGFSKSGFDEGSVLFDLANSKDKEFVPLYYISNIEWMWNNSSQFFANITLIGYVKNVYNERNNGDFWYEYALKPLIEELKGKLSNTSVFAFKKRAQLKKFIETLKLMLKSY